MTSLTYFTTYIFLDTVITACSFNLFNIRHKKLLYHQHFSCQTLYSTLSSAKAGEVLQLQNTDMRYKE